MSLQKPWFVFSFCRHNFSESAMAKQKSEVGDDDDHNDQRAVFVDTSLNTHLVLLVLPTDTISLLKQKILLEHPKCFPDFGEIKINALKVKRRGCYYHLLDSMFVKTAFHGVAKNWFLFADTSSQIVCTISPLSDHALINAEPPKTLPTLATTSKRLEPENDDDRCGKYSDVNKVAGLEMPNKIVSVEETLNRENLEDSDNKKKSKKNRKRTREHDDDGHENGERTEDLPSNRVGGDVIKPTDNVADELSPSTRVKKKHKVVNKDAEVVSLSKTEADVQKIRSDDVNDSPCIGDSKDIVKRKKEKRHRKQDVVQEETQLHYQPEGTRTKSDKLDNREIENDNGGLAPVSRTKKKKKVKYDEIPDFLENGDAPTQNKNATNTLENSGSMEVETRAKKKKVKKGSNEVAAARVLSSGHVENDENDDFTAKADRDDSTHRTDKKRNKVKKISKFSKDGDQEADDVSEIGAVPHQRAEINKPSVCVEIQGEKAKRKSQKKQTVSIKDSPDLSVKERSGEKTTETDMLKADDASLLVDNDHYKDTNRHASKQKVKKHDLPSSVDTLCSGHNMVSSNENKSGRTHDDVTNLKDDDPEVLGKEALQPPSIGEAEENVEIMSDKSKKKTEAEENVEIMSDKSKKKTEKKQTTSKDPPLKSPIKKRTDEKSRQTAVPNSADGDLLVNTVVKDANPQGEASLVDDHDEKLHDILPSDSAGLTEIRNRDNPHITKQVVEKLNLPSSSIDTSSNQPSSSKSKKSKKGERTSEIKELISVEKQDMLLSQPSEKPSETLEEGIKSRDSHADPINTVAKLAMHNENVSPEEDTGIGSPNRKTWKTKEPQKKPVESVVGLRRSTRKKMGEVVNYASPQKKGLLATPGAIFEDGSSASSDDGHKVDGSDCSTRTPSDNFSSSDYSEGESKGDTVTSQHDSLKGGVQDGANSNSLDLKNLTLHTVLRSSSRYKKAKVLASQSQLEDSEQPVDVVPDSQANH